MGLTVGTFLSPRLRPAYKQAAVALGEALGTEAELVEGEEFDQLLSVELDAAFMCGLPYVRLREQAGEAVEPLVAPALDAEGPVYRSEVVARAGEGAHRIEDMAGRRLAVNQPDSYSGYALVMATLARRGVPAGRFAEVVLTGSHASSLDAVRSGRADVAAIDSHLLAALAADDPSLGSELTTIESLGPSPSQPLVAGPALGLAERVLAQEALREVGPVPLGPGVELARWADVDDAAYDPLRRMCAAVAERSAF